MKKINITTPENIEVEYTLADLGSRTAAAVIDMLLQGLFTLLLIAAILLLANFSPDYWEKYYGWIIGIALLLNTIISYGYFIVMELTMNGRTLGKKMLKLRTIRTNGQPITLRHSALRNIFRVVIDMYGVGAVLIFFNKMHKRLGDLVASTIVVVEESQVRPTVHESLQKISESYQKHLSEEEYVLLKDYFDRKSSMADSNPLQEEMQRYFTKKFEDLGILSEWKSFIDAL